MTLLKFIKTESNLNEFKKKPKYYLQKSYFAVVC